MKRIMRRVVREILRRSPAVVADAVSRPPEAPIDMGAEFGEIYRACLPYTLTSVDRMYAVYNAVNHLVARGVPGDVVECGVWKGGSAMVAARTLLARGEDTRTLYLYDTYAGMVEPTERDVHVTGGSAREKWQAFRREDRNDWCYASLEEVRANLLATGWSERRLRFVVGRVEETIPRVAPERIALLRLDTDFYDSTYHELVHLYPRLSAGGALIVDDYGAWKGSAEATDRYLRERGLRPLLHRIDHTGRMFTV